MITVSEGKHTLQFPDGWLVEHYDRWPFYRNQFQSSCGGNKGADFLALEPDGETFWLIEIKNYDHQDRNKELELWNEIALKSRDTLAGLVATWFNGVDPHRQYARRYLRARKLRIVFHLEQPAKPSRLFPRAFDLANVQLKLRQTVRPLDPHALVVDKQQMGRVPWTVT